MTKRQATQHLAAQARNYTDDAILFLKAVMYGDERFVTKDGRTIQVEVAPIKDRLQAVNALMDRGHGKPAQAVTLGDEEGEGNELIHASAADILARRLASLAPARNATQGPGGPDGAAEG